MLGMNMRMGMTVRVDMHLAAIMSMLMFRTIDVERAGATHRARHRVRSDGLVDDLADGASTTAALGATAKAAIDVAGRATGRGAHSVAHLVVGQHIAGANDHPVTELNARCRGVNENRSLNWF